MHTDVAHTDKGVFKDKNKDIKQAEAEVVPSSSLVKLS